MTTSIRSRRQPRRAATGKLIATALVPWLTALLTPAAAQETARESVEPPTLYEVELIVFANRGFDPGEELLARQTARSARALQTSEPVLAGFEFGPAGNELPFGTDLRDRVYSDSAAGGAADVRGNAPGDVIGAAPAGNGAAPASDSATPAGDSAISAGDSAAAAGAVAGTDTAAPPDPFAGSPATAQFRFRLLRPEELELGAVRRRLDAESSQYDVLLHGGWLQEGLPLESAQPFNLAYLGRGNPSGTVRLHVSRFVHVALDLDYRVPTGPGGLRPGAIGPGGIGPEAIGSGGTEPGAIGSGGMRTGSGPFDPVPSPSRPGGFDQGAPGVRTSAGFGGGAGAAPATRDALQPIELPPRYRLRQERRMRSGEAHYIDHPAFGVIIIVRPWEPPVEDPAGSEGGLRPAA